MFTSVIIPGPPDESDSFSHELRGVIPRGFEYMFSLINREQEKVSHDSLSSIVWIGGELSIGEEKMVFLIRLTLSSDCEETPCLNGKLVQ